MIAHMLGVRILTRDLVSCSTLLELLSDFALVNSKMLQAVHNHA